MPLPFHPKQVGLLLIDGFALMSYAAIVEPFRAANVLAGQALYSWRHFSVSGPMVAASNGVRITTDAVMDPQAAPEPLPDIVFVFAAGNPAAFDDRPTLRWLRRLSTLGVQLGGVSGGPYVLARAGLLDGYRCTIHWEHRPAFVEAFPDLRVEQGLYVIDRDRLTCAGGTAGLDLALALIAADHGPALATQVGDWYIRSTLRDGEDAQRLALRERYAVGNERVLTALALMESHVADPLERSALAAAAGVSLRQLERLFASHLGRRIGDQYLRIRLERALALLRETSLAVTEVAMATGFVSPSHFSRSFARRYGLPPGRMRQRG